MVIGKITALDDLGAERFERGVELRRPADSGESEHPASGEFAGILRDERRTEHRQGSGDGRLAAALILADDDDRLGSAKTPPDRLAQRPRWHYHSIAEPIGAVDDDEGEILDQRRVLKTIVEQHELGAGGNRRARPGDPVARHEAWRRPRQEQRLVTDVTRTVPRRVDADRVREIAAIAAHDDVRSVFPLSKQ